MPDQFDELKIVITFSHPSGRVPSRDLTRCVEHCAEAIYESELQDILDTAWGDIGIPRFIIDTMRFRLESLKGQILYIENASEGSIVLGTLVAAASLWVIQNTLGEVTKEAWKETDLRAKLKNLLLTRLHFRRQEIGEKVKDRIEKDKELSLKVDVGATEDHEAPIRIFILISPKYDEQPFPMRGDFTFD
jgi:hypothetical protein